MSSSGTKMSAALVAAAVMKHDQAGTSGAQTSATPTPPSIASGGEGETEDEAFCRLVSLVLARVASTNDALGGGLVSRFHAKAVPAISIQQYISRIMKYAACSSQMLVAAIVYIDRVVAKFPQVHFNSLSLHRMLMTAVLLVSKFFNDRPFNNEFFARVGGVTTAELNRLEIDFLFMLNFDLNVLPEQLAAHEQSLRLAAETYIRQQQEQNELLQQLVAAEQVSPVTRLRQAARPRSSSFRLPAKPRVIFARTTQRSRSCTEFEAAAVALALAAPISLSVSGASSGDLHDAVASSSDTGATAAAATAAAAAAADSHMLGPHLAPQTAPLLQVSPAQLNTGKSAPVSPVPNLPMSFSESDPGAGGDDLLSPRTVRSVCETLLAEEAVRRKLGAEIQAQLVERARELVALETLRLGEAAFADACGDEGVMRRVLAQLIAENDSVLSPSLLTRVGSASALVSGLLSLSEDDCAAAAAWPEPPRAGSPIVRPSS